VAAKPKVCADTQGLLLGVLVHAASIQDADGAGDLLGRVKPLYCWRRTVFADSIYNRVAALLACKPARVLACFLLGITLVIVGRIPGTKGFVVLPRTWGSSGHSAGSAAGGVCPRITSTCPKSPKPWSLAMIRLMLHRVAHPNRKRLPAP
jgi:putative transposase